jgi:hypothetical protein
MPVVGNIFHWRGTSISARLLNFSKLICGTIIPFFKMNQIFEIARHQSINPIKTSIRQIVGVFNFYYPWVFHSMTFIFKFREQRGDFVSVTTIKDLQFTIPMLE